MSCKTYLPFNLLDPNLTYHMHFPPLAPLRIAFYQYQKAVAEEWANSKVPSIALGPASIKSSQSHSWRVFSDRTACITRALLFSVFTESCKGLYVSFIFKIMSNFSPTHRTQQLSRLHEIPFKISLYNFPSSCEARLEEWIAGDQDWCSRIYLVCLICGRSG